jgi:hypothetical protein
LRSWLPRTHCARPVSIELLDEMNDGGAFGAAVGEIADKDEVSVMGMPSLFVVSQMSHQGAKRLDFAMHIAHDVERSVEEGLDERSSHSRCYQFRHFRVNVFRVRHSPSSRKTLEFSRGSHGAGSGRPGNRVAAAKSESYCPYVFPRDAKHAFDNRVESNSQPCKGCPSQPRVAQRTLGCEIASIPQPCRGCPPGSRSAPWVARSRQYFNPVGVAHQSPGSRSAPWVARSRQYLNPVGVAHGTVREW